MDQNAHNTRRIAKNTLVLYVRMLVLMLVGLYTSRVVLSALGENDFGIYDVVGGVVAMFTIISGSLNSAISRFITFEMGKGDQSRMNKVYSTAVTIQLVIAAVVAASMLNVPRSIVLSSGIAPRTTSNETAYLTLL